MRSCIQLQLDRLVSRKLLHDKRSTHLIHNEVPIAPPTANSVIIVVRQTQASLETLHMDHSHGQRRGNEDGQHKGYHHGNQSSRYARPPPTDYQYPIRPAQAQRNQPSSGLRSQVEPSQLEHGRQDQFGRRHILADSRPRHQAFHSPHQSRGLAGLQPPPPVSDSPGRHLSHISALSSAQSYADSRPVSEIGSERVVADLPPAPHASVRTNSRVRDRISASDSQTKHGFSVRTEPMSSTDTTLQALTSAIKQGLGPSKVSSRSITPKPLSDTKVVRMPFQNEPGSPTSVYTELTAAQDRDTLRLSSYQGYDLRESRPSTITEQDVEDFEKSRFASDIPTPMSQVSTYPMLDKDGHGMSERIPPSKRPPRLDIAAVREAEARGSMTSLSDLIRRATRLASNLDRGKTASRSNLDMFINSERLDGKKVRDSTYSDVLDAFPPPADGSVTSHQNRPATMWPTHGKQYMTSKSSLGQYGDGNIKQQRKCCGLTPLAFVLTLMLLLLLVAAAVLIPVFLMVLPKQHQKTLGECSSSHICHNEGVKLTVNGQCSCICVAGFTGSDCSQEGDPECATTSLRDGNNVYENATIGTALLPILQPDPHINGIPLNTTTILATFAANNLSCASENSLVVFDQISKRRNRRSWMANRTGPAPEAFQSVSNPDLKLRQDATQSSNGIVFATTSQNSQPTATSVSVSAAPTATGNGQKVIGNDTLNFAAAVVLYVLQTNSEINAAVSAKQAMTAYFEESNPTNDTIEVVGGPQRITVDFDTFKINFANGTHVGGK